jgi:chromosome segregation ATPase
LLNDLVLFDMTDNKTKTLPSGDDLASQALESSKVKKIDDGKDEVAKSDELAETLGSLQRLIESHANKMGLVNHELKEKRSSLRNVFDNDETLADAQQEASEVTTKVKERKSQLQADSQVTSLKVEIAELNEQKKEIEETLSNHLVNYHQLTNSTSFDTSDGDQWDFNIRAKIKPKKVERDD